MGTIRTRIRRGEVAVPVPEPSSTSFDLDSFPVGIAARALRTPQVIGYAAAYGVMAVFLLIRIATSKQRDSHRRGAYWCFLLLSLCRITMFALGAVVVHRLATAEPDGTPAWALLLAMDMLSIVGYAEFCAAVYALRYSWRGRVTSCFYSAQKETFSFKSAIVYLVPVIVLLPAIAGSIVRLIAAKPEATHTPDPILYHKGEVLAKVGTIAAVTIAVFYVLAIPYSMYIRWQRARLHRDDDSMYQERKVGMRGFKLLWAFAFCLVPCGAWFVILAFTARITSPTWEWARSPAALAFVVAPEFIALALICLCDIDGLDLGAVRLWVPGSTRTPYSSDKGISHLSPAPDYYGISNLTYGLQPFRQSTDTKHERDDKDKDDRHVQPDLELDDLSRPLESPDLPVSPGLPVSVSYRHQSTFSHDSSEIGTAH